jgi:hypothetical protein
MAKYIIEYDIYIGDSVRFLNGDLYQYGIVQDISQMPDIWVEGFEDGKYKRWCRGIESLEFISSDHDSGVSTKGEVTEGEEIEFVHEGDVGTPGFKKLIYTFHHIKKNGRK